MEEQSSAEMYNPHVADDLKPKIGQPFNSVNDAYAFYNAYAKEAGFSTRMDSSKLKNKELIWKQFVCFKQGDTDDTYQKRKLKKIDQGESERNRGIVRVGCKARLSVVKRETNWIVSKFIEEHNHILATPRKVHLLKSHRHVSNAKKVLARQFSEANVSTSQQIRIMEIEAGGIENVGCTGRDLRNYERDVREEMKGHDADILYEYFTSEKEKNPLFYFEFDQDEENRMTRCFWADSTSRRAYSFFGDVVVFDTTYNTNKYSMIFAPLLGVNHHGQTIIFGCGFLSDETTESFVWLFKQWLQAMIKGPPNIIITDQDPAMSKAISEVLPQTFHRYCIWHIMNKFSEKLGPINHRDYYYYFQSSVWNSDTSEQFEASWKYALQRSSLEDHVWLSTMYELREKWVPAYINHIFSAGMSSSQRAESSHSFFKKYVSKNNSLMDFVTRFNMAVGHQRHQELISDHIDINEKPKLKSLFPMEKQMVDVYTKKIFRIFQDELFESHAYFLKQVCEDEMQCVYTVERAEEGNSKVREIVFYKNSDIARCGCRFFEFEGIPCRHILAYLRLKQVLYLPNHYILHRWTRSAKAGRIWDADGVELNDVSNMSLMTRHAKLSQLSSSVVDDASLSEEGTEFLITTLQSAREKIKDLNISSGVSGMKSTCIPENRVINDPQQVRAKGCGNRLKSSKEKAIRSGGRLCRGCGLRGQSHDKRNCPLLNDRSNINDDNESSDELQQSDAMPLTGLDFDGSY